ncbi:hypothetical protein PAPHI01_0680 [Pancytospora philotis]|nr:hypothetical protein PAPHI01_0680 [Pancytospora philotis]
MLVRQASKILIFTEVFVSARLSTFTIMDALTTWYGDCEYVDPEGPLNIMRGQPCVNNDMIAKLRKFGAPMRLGYSCTDDASEGRCLYTRNACEDVVRELPADGEAVVYLSEYYAALKSMFTVENDVVVANRGSQAPFCGLFKSGRERCTKLFAALLILAGGGDIRLILGSGGTTAESKRTASLVAYDAAGSSHVLDLDPADIATLEVVEFFAKYGGSRASQVAGYGLHYTDRPSFLIQAYICEFLRNEEEAVDMFAAAKRIVAKLSPGDSSAQQGLRFFTKDQDYACAYIARYYELVNASLFFYGARRVLLMNWQDLSPDRYSDGGDSRNIVSVLLKLYYCLCANPVGGYHNMSLRCDSKNKLRCALSNFAHVALFASNDINYQGACPKIVRESVGKHYKKFLRVAAAEATASETIMNCCGEGISAGLVTDPKNFLVVLAWALGEREEELRSLRQLLDDAVGDAGSASHCQRISERVAEMFERRSANHVEAHFDICTAADGARHGALKLFVQSVHAGIVCDYGLELVFKPAKVEIMYIGQQAALKSEWRDRFGYAVKKLDHALKELEIPRSSVLSASAHDEAYRRNNPSLCALIRDSIARCLDHAAWKAASEADIAEVSAAGSPLACHAALSRWMARRPMQSLGEMGKAGDQLLLVLEGLRTQGSRNSDPARWLTHDSPIVAVLDNILGSVAVFNDALRPYIVRSLCHCVGERADLFPGVFLVAGVSPCALQGRGGSACGHCRAYFAECEALSTDSVPRQTEQGVRASFEMEQ